MMAAAHAPFGERLASVDQAAPLCPLDVVRLADVEPEIIHWLWRGRIARGKVTMVVGDPGDGKSYLTLAVAAAVSCGNALPDSEPMLPADCILWNGEDGLEDTIRVRAERVGGADLQRLHVIRGAMLPDGSRTGFGLQHLPDLFAEVARRQNVEMIVIDPLGALLTGIDSHKDAEVRSGLQPLADLARETGAAVLVVAHLNKATAQRALYRVGGSIGFVGMARSVLLVAKDHETGRRAVAQVKSNLAEQVAPVEFRIDDQGFWWMGVAEDLSSDRLLSDPKETSALDEAKRAILDAFEDGAEVAARDLDRIVRDAGVSEGTYKRARAALVREHSLIRRGGNPHQRELRWALGSLNQAAPYVQNLIQTTNVIQTTSSLNHPPLSESSSSSLNQNNGSPARASVIGTTARGKICSTCKRVDRCYPCSDGRFICAECRGEA
ncbi:MAG: AAA family ATPase [Vulcanimicrobiaceae bacterium]